MYSVPICRELHDTLGVAASPQYAAAAAVWGDTKHRMQKPKQQAVQA